MSAFVDVLGADELADGAMIEVEVGGEAILLARAGDRYFATQARCPHLRGRLARGTLEGTVVTCPRHGSQFDVTDGNVIRWTDWSGVAQAAAEALRHPRPLVTYEVRVEGGRVMVGAEKEPPPHTA
ncbi:MAG: Rieske 2Fe-2S domain-containing protein [Coriobacteriia bacterium]|nr:Rieske 2Fe-2S domain-containing protein [Coriobacteriia bacterium]